MRQIIIPKGTTEGSIMAQDYYFNKKKNSDNTVNDNTSEIENDNLDYDEPSPDKPQKNKTKKKHLIPKIILSIIALLLVFTVIAAAGGIGLLFSAYKPTEYKANEYVTESKLKKSPSVTNILFIGQDSEGELADTSRSDSMILVSINSADKTIKLTSFMRDLWVNIPGHGGAKLNAACQYGGSQLLCDTIESVFGLNIDGFCRVNFDVFQKVVDTLGGITVPEISEAESESLARSYVHVAPGINVKLNGAEALMYCRIRNGVGDDFGRTARQREMITLLIKKAVKSSPSTLVSVVKTVLSDVEMSLSEKQLISLAFTALPCLTSDIEQQQIPASGMFTDQYMSGQDSLVGDIPANTEVLYEFIYGDK